MFEKAVSASTENKTIEEEVYKYFKVWLQSPVFLDNNISDSIRITFLQVLYLMVEIDETNTFKELNVPLQFINDAIERMSNEKEKNTRLIENSLILLITQKMLIKKEYIEHFYKQIFGIETISQLLTIRDKNLALRAHVDYIFHQLY